MEQKCNKVAFVNGKGGCGKTTSLFNVAGVLSSRGYKVLVVDLDWQKSATTSFLANSELPNKTIYDFFTGHGDLAEAVSKAYCLLPRKRKEQYYNVDCIVSDVRMVCKGNDSPLWNVDIEYIRNCFDAFIQSKGYDWVLVDMPPSNSAINHICFSALVNYCVIPLLPRGHSIHGYGLIVEAINEERVNNPSLNVLGTFLSCYNNRITLEQAMLSYVQGFRTYMPVTIPYSYSLVETVDIGRPISYYKPKSKSCEAYEKLVDIMINRINEHSN